MQTKYDQKKTELVAIDQRILEVKKLLEQADEEEKKNKEPAQADKSEDVKEILKPESIIEIQYNIIRIWQRNATTNGWYLGC